MNRTHCHRRFLRGAGRHRVGSASNRSSVSCAGAEAQEYADKGLIAVIDTIPEGACLVRASDTVIIYANAKSETMLGYGPGELDGIPFSVLGCDSSDSGEGPTRTITTSLIETGRWQGEVCSRRKDGSSCRTEAKISTFKHLRHGDVWVIIQSNIAECKRSEERLLASRTMLDTIIDSIPQSVFWKDRSGVFVGCNEAFARAVGIDDPADIVGKTDYDLPLPKEEADAHSADDREVMDNARRKVHIIEPLQLVDGTRLWLDTTKVPLFDGEGNTIGIVGIFDDITERKWFEDQLRWKTAFLSALADSAPDGLLVIDDQGRKVAANRRFFHIWQLSESAERGEQDILLLDEAIARLKYPREFIDRVEHLYSHRDETSLDEIELVDGTVLDRYTSPVIGSEDGKVLWQSVVLPRYHGTQACGASPPRQRDQVPQAISERGRWDCCARVPTTRTSGSFRRGQ